MDDGEVNGLGPLRWLEVKAQTQLLIARSFYLAGSDIGMEIAVIMSGGEGEPEFVYRISTAKEWEELQKNGSIFGGDLDKSSGFIHLSKLDQVQSTLQNFFLNSNLELYLLQIDAKKLGDGLVYEVVDGTNSFPHFYGPSRSFSPLTLDAVTKAEKLSLSEGRFSCSLLD